MTFTVSNDGMKELLWHKKKSLSSLLKEQDIAPGTLTAIFREVLLDEIAAVELSGGYYDTGDDYTELKRLEARVYELVSMVQ